MLRFRVLKVAGASSTLHAIWIAEKRSRTNAKQ